jgi:prepilin-type N-terminal cleavage/methylation domain-containing protein
MRGFFLDRHVALRAPWSNPRRARTDRAFTLIELLVVTFIILILLSILLPAFRRSIQQARATVCAGNLKAIDQMMQIYRLETGGWLPHIPQDQPDAPDAPEPAWFDMLKGRYLVDLSVLICPDDPCRVALEWAARTNGLGGQANASSYGYSEFVLGSPGSYLAYVDRYSPRRPLDTLILADMGPDNGPSQAPAGALAYTTPDRNEGRLPWSDGRDLGDVDLSGPWLTRRHGNSINVLTLGGAVRSVRTTELMRQAPVEYYDFCAAGSCTFCLDLHARHYSFAHTRTFWWTGPVPTP